MGGGNYSFDVAKRARSSNSDVFSYEGYGNDADSASARREVHPILNPFEKIRECTNQTPIVVASDVTRSRGNDSKIIYEKLPMLIGQIELKGYVEGAAISFAAIGDATVDEAPLQVSQFEADNRLDEALSKFWLEEGGGGSGQETYELAAYYYARRTKLATYDNHKEKGYFFFIGDEGFYPKVSKEHIKKVLGVEESKDIDAKKIFQELQEKFEVFFIYPQKSWEERKSDIDAEIKQRVEAAGGQYKDVDVRASLIWNNRNDLDLHVITPSGEEIFYQHTQSACGGWLDVDMNVQGESTKPVENVRWKKGEAPKGQYKIIVQNYGYHEQKQGPTDFKVEVEVNGEIKHFNGTVSPNNETGGSSNVTVYEFDYDPEQRQVTEEEQEELDVKYANYDDSVIKDQWASVIPEENILIIDDANSIIDVMLGALALKSGTSDLDTYLIDMKSRENVPLRIEQTERALLSLSNTTTALTKVSVQNLPTKKDNKNKSKTKRL